MSGRKTNKVALVNGTRVRITRLDACGRIVYGDNNVAISKGFVSVALKAATSSTTAVDVKNANGESIVNEPAETSFSNYGVDIVFAEVDPELFALISGQRVLHDAFGQTTGFTVDTNVSLQSQGVAIEVWTGSPSGDACSDSNAQGSFGYILLPFVKGGYLSDHTISEGGISFTIAGATTKDGNAWGRGPYKVQINAGGQPGPLVDPLTTTEHEAVLLVGVAPPAPVDGTRPQLDPAKTAVTTITATTTGLSVDLDVTPDAAVGTGVWWEFGDGTWDYIDGGAVTHAFPSAGTYTVQASTNGTWVSKSVTVS